MNKAEPLRIELTILDGKLHREEVLCHQKPAPHFLYSTPYEEAVSTPFPDEGKQGLSIFVGRAEQFMKAEVPLLWGLEAKRGRHRMAVVTNLRGKGFVPALGRLETCLGDSLLIPISFLRRRGQAWDSLDFFSCGSSPSVEGAAPRLKRLKQRVWEMVVDRLALTDPAIKSQYFEELFVERDTLQKAFLEGMKERRISAVVGIAGQCLQKQHLSLLLRETMNSRIVQALSENFSPPQHPGWTYLAKRASASELILLSEGEAWLKEQDTLTSHTEGGERASELLVTKVLQRTQSTSGESSHTVMRVKVEWRYRPAREIPVNWSQNSTLPAGSEAVHG